MDSSLRGKGIRDGEDDRNLGVPKYTSFGKSVDTSKLKTEELTVYSNAYEDGFNWGIRWES